LKSVEWLCVLLVIGLVVQSPIAVIAQSFTDPVGDLFDRQGKPVTAEAYLDIVEVEVVQSRGEYRARIRVNGPLPTALSDPSIFIEWDLLVDIDQDWGTNPWGPWPLLDNGIGVDVLIRLMLGPSGQGYRAEVYDLATRKRSSILFKTEEAVIELNFDSSLVTSPKAFDYVFSVRKFGNYGRSGGEIACDKAPNEGYFTFSNGKASLTMKTIKPGLPTEKTQTEHAIICYNQGNDDKAKWYGKAFEAAYTEVGKDLEAYPARQFALYLYLAQEDLVNGLQTYSGFSADEANYFKTSAAAAPRPINYVMHIAPSFDWHDVTHEYTHTIIEELSRQVYRSIKWLDEGLAEYEAYATVLKTKYNQTELRRKADAMRRVYDALDKGKLFSLKELSSDTDWHNRLPGTPERNLQYSESWIIVNYLAMKYQPSKCKTILLALKQGQTQDSALQSELGVSATQFESNFRQYLQSIREDAPTRVAEAEKAIQEAESEGRTVGLSQAKSLIQDAKDAMSAGDYERAISLADRAKELASKATAPQVTTTTSPSTKITSEVTTVTSLAIGPDTGTMYAIGVVAVIIVAALLLTRYRKKTQKRA